MTKIMVSDRPVSVIHHDTASYKPNKAGEFEVEDSHVDGLRPHGLMLKEEVEAKKAAADDKSEVAALKARITELEKALADATKK